MTFVVGLVAGPGAGGAAAQRSGSAADDRFVPGEVLIQYRDGVTETDKAAARGKARASHQEKVGRGHAAGNGDLELASLPPGRAVADAIRDLETDPAVVFAEPNWVYTLEATSNDPYYTGGSLWGMYGDATKPTNQYGSQAGEAWGAGRIGSKSVYVGVIDEGIQLSHPDLDANIWTNPFDPVNGIDDDGNGYVDDVNGWDFVGNNNTIYDGGKKGSQDSHGTHVAGTIGAEGGNSTGVVGVNWNVTMISGKFLGTNGGTTANAIKAVQYFTDLKARHGLNIVATNNSWGGGGYSQALHDAIIRAAKADILFVAAAGNSSSDNDATAQYPANYDTTVATGTESAASYNGVIAVAAITNTGQLASFSNYGARTIHLAAPGAAISSTLPFNKYGSYSGTSMATPHVSGAAALYASTRPGATAAQIRDAILTSAVPTPSLSGKTVTGGRLNVGGF